MDIVQAQTFLAVAAHGSFVEAATRLHVTQSTVSARIRGLEQDLGATLFVRNRSGATLTGAGSRFLPHARNLVLTATQARHEVGLSGGFRAAFRIAGRIALWEEYLPRWTAWMTDRAPDIALQVEIGFEEDMIGRLLSGTLDLGVMYTPRHNPGLVIEELFDDTLILVSTRERDDRPADRYVYIDWGPGFYAAQRAGCPDLQNPSRTANIGWLALQLFEHSDGCCYLPRRMAAPLLRSGRLFPVPGRPSFSHPAYAVYPRDGLSPALADALEGLRLLATDRR